MPLVHIALQAGKPDTYRQAIFDNVYHALHETFNVPADDQFMVITEHDVANFRYSPSYLNVARSQDVIYIQITASNTRSKDQKKALFKRLAQLLSESPGARPEDVFISLVEVEKENWSLGNGLAQYA